MKKTGKKFDKMKMYKEEKTQDLQTKWYKH